MPQIFLITWVTHNSRISERMRLYEEVIIAHRTEKPDLGNEIPVEFSSDEEAEIAVYLIEIIQKDKLQILAMNICQDHVHMIIVCDFEELSRVVQKLKGGSSYKYQKMRRDRHGVLTPGGNGNNFSNGLKPVVGNRLWAQKFNTVPLPDEQAVQNACHYVYFNRQKHGLPENRELATIIQPILVHPDDIS